MPTNRRQSLVLGAAALALASLGAQAQTYPDKPITFVVPFTAGSATDQLARALAQGVGAESKQSVVVDNKPGANAFIGAQFVAKARPDGYTLSMGLTGTLGINPELFKTLPYDVTKDFVPIATVAEQPVVLVVRADSPYKTVADVVAAHKAKGGLTLASAGAGTVGQLVGEMFGRMVGTRFTNVPYKGSAPALQDVAGGVAEAMFATPPGALPLLQGGRLRALAVTSSKRLPLLPEVPTMAEAGFRNFQVSEWKLLVAPAGTPPAVVQRLNQEVQKALAQPTTIARVIADGSLPMTSSAPEAGRFLKAELTRWTGLVRESGLSKSN